MLSMTSSGAGPPAWAARSPIVRATAAMSVTLSSGFDGVSSQTRRVARGQRFPERVRPRGEVDVAGLPAPAGRWTRSK